MFLTKKELAELQADFPAEYEKYMERLSQYIASSGKRYENYAATICYWISTDKEKAANKTGSKTSNGIPDYSYKEGESL